MNTRSNDSMATAKLRQTRTYFAPGPFVPSEAGSALDELIARLRPWADESLVSRELRQWAERYWPPSQWLALGTLDVAAHLGEIGGPGGPAFDDETVAAITFGWLCNVWAGREVDQYDLLGVTVKGYPARTMRRYRSEHADPNRPHAPLFAFLNSLNHRRTMDIRRMVEGGRTEAAARRWLERNPGKHFEDAPPPRQRRGA